MPFSRSLDGDCCVLGSILGRPVLGRYLPHCLGSGCVRHFPCCYMHFTRVVGKE